MNAIHHNTAHSLTIESRTQRLEEVRAFISNEARMFGFNEDVISQITLAVDEACTNVIKHAYRMQPDHSLTVLVTTENVSPNRKFVVTIRDTGLTFDPSGYSAPDMKEYFMRMKRGGLGIVLIRKLMDEVHYASDPSASNSITLVKYLPVA